MSACITCHIETNKYKCPKCRAFYCSVICCQKHKENCSVTSQQDLVSTGTTTQAEEQQQPTPREPFTTEDTVPLIKLTELRNSENLCNLLYNPHLRNLLGEIDTSQNAWKAISAAMQEPIFVEFAVECLKVIDPLSEEDERELSHA